MALDPNFASSLKNYFEFLGNSKDWEIQIFGTTTILLLYITWENKNKIKSGVNA